MAYAELIAPAKVYLKSEVFRTPSPVPRVAGVYAWYFKELPDGVPTYGCITHAGLTLLYVGISPKAPPTNGAGPSTQTLYDRIRYHYSGNAEGSTLRLSLGCLLSERLGIELRRVGSGRRMTFGTGEGKLSEWMSRNALVTWTTDARPWEIEEELIGRLSLPLNLDQNRVHAFHSVLSAQRREAKERARQLPVIANM